MHFSRMFLKILDAWSVLDYTKVFYDILNYYKMFYNVRECLQRIQNIAKYSGTCENLKIYSEFTNNNYFQVSKDSKYKSDIRFEKLKMVDRIWDFKIRKIIFNLIKQFIFMFWVSVSPSLIFRFKNGDLKKNQTIFLSINATLQLFKNMSQIVTVFNNKKFGIWST